MARSQVLVLTALAMLAFAGNSLLCRLALAGSHMDAASFTAVRIVAGALVLWLIVRMRAGRARGDWGSALALFVYAAGFSFAYLSVPAASGALLLFGAVQASMIGYGLWSGERLRPRQTAGLVCASAGLVGLLLPGLSAPAPLGAASMLAAGIAWGVYSLRGRGTGDPTMVTAGNFLRAAPLALLLIPAACPWLDFDAAGIGYAVASGALASGVGYAIWYAALKDLRATTAATVQLSVPIITALGGAALLSEPVTVRLALASAAVLGGIALVILGKPPSSQA